MIDIEKAAEFSKDLHLPPDDDWIKTTLEYAKQQKDKATAYLGLPLTSPFFLALLAGTAVAIVLLCVAFIQVAHTSSDNSKRLQAGCAIVL